MPTRRYAGSSGGTNENDHRRCGIHARGNHGYGQPYLTCAIAGNCLGPDGKLNFVARVRDLPKTPSVEAAQELVYAGYSCMPSPDDVRTSPWSERTYMVGCGSRMYLAVFYTDDSGRVLVMKAFPIGSWNGDGFGHRFADPPKM